MEQSRDKPTPWVQLCGGQAGSKVTAPSASPLKLRRRRELQSFAPGHPIVVGGCKRRPGATTRKMPAVATFAKDTKNRQAQGKKPNLLLLHLTLHKPFLGACVIIRINPMTNSSRCCKEPFATCGERIILYSHNNGGSAVIRKLVEAYGR